jgi:hypothetical protein
MVYITANASHQDRQSCITLVCDVPVYVDSVVHPRLALYSLHGWDGTWPYSLQYHSLCCM